LIRIYRGSAGGLATTPSWTIPLATIADGLAASNDVNGDGYPDLLVAQPRASTVLVFFGGASGLSTTPSISLSEGSPSGFGTSASL
jgi:hypothetical protein